MERPSPLVCASLPLLSFTSLRRRAAANSSRHNRRANGVLVRERQLLAPSRRHWLAALTSPFEGRADAIRSMRALRLVTLAVQKREESRRGPVAMREALAIMR